MQLKDLLNKSLYIQGHIYNLTEVGLDAGLTDDEYVVIPKEVWYELIRRVEKLFKPEREVIYYRPEVFNINLRYLIKMLEGLE